MTPDETTAQRIREIRERSHVSTAGYLTEAEEDRLYLLDAYTQSEQARQEAEQQLEEWQTCMYCGDKMVAPGHCTNGASEEQRASDRMIDSLLTRAEKAEAEAARLRAALEDCRAYLNGSAPVLDGMALLSEVKAALASSGTIPESPKNG